jgi:hypothetical protein
VKDEKVKRKNFRVELNRDKKMAAKVAKREPKGEMMLETKEGGI